MIFTLFTVLSAALGFGSSFYSVQIGVSPLLKGTLFAGVCVFLIGLAILIGGYLVWLYRQGRFPSLNGVVAGQIATLSNAGIIAGGALIGLWGGSILGEFEIWNIVFTRFNPEVVAVLAALFLLVASFITRWICRIKSGGDELGDAKMSARGAVSG